MEDRRKTAERGPRLDDPADRVEYDTLVKRYREEEQRTNMKNLLYGTDRLSPGEKPAE